MLINRRSFVTLLAWLSASNRFGAGKGPNPSDAGDVAWLDEVQQPPVKIPEGAPIDLPPLLRDADGNEITTVAGWEKRRAEIRREWERFLRPLDLDRPQPKLTVIEEDRPPGCIRRLVRYESEPGLSVEGYLLLPEKVRGRIPGVVALHSTVGHTIRQPAGVEGVPEKAFGLKLAQQGIAAFCPKCFLWNGDGDYLEQVRQFESRHPGSLGMAKMLWDAMRAVDVLVSFPEVDPKRIGSVGHSLGGKEVLYLAAFDERVRVTVSSEGGIATPFSNWHAPWYLGDAVQKPDFRHEHHELLALIAPRPFLLVGGDASDGAKSWPVVEAALPVYRLYGSPARLGLYNHKQGHAVPPEAERRIYQWLQTYLG